MSKRARTQVVTKESGDPPPSANQPIIGGADDADTTNERNNWTSDNADNFHWVLSKYTWFINGVLQLEHRYLDIRDIREVEGLEVEFESLDKPLDDDEKNKRIIQHLEITNASNPNKDVKRWFNLLRELQHAAGSKHSVRQINTKHINTRSRWSVPFKSLHEVGYLIKNQATRGSKRTNAEELRVRKEPINRTNIEKKNLAAIKALRKYAVCRYIYWNDETNSIPTPKELANLPPISSDMEDNSEPERWIRAMIRRHGKEMVSYLDVCAVNLAKNYVKELAERGDIAADSVNISFENTSGLVKIYLHKLVGEIMRISKGPLTTTNRSASVTSSDKESKKQMANVSKLSIAVQPIATPTPVSAFSATINEDAFESFGSQHYRNEDKRGAELLEADDNEASNVKRTKSHTAFNLSGSIGNKLGSWESTQNDDKRSSLNFQPAEAASAQGSMFDFSSLGNISAFAKSLFAGNDAAEKPQQYDDEYFTQFINTDGQAIDMSAINKGISRQQSLPGANDANLGKNSPAPTELLDAIINLSMNSSGNNSINVGQLNEKNGLQNPATTDFSFPQQPNTNFPFGLSFDNNVHQIQPNNVVPLPMTPTTGGGNSIYIKNNYAQEHQQPIHGAFRQFQSPPDLSRSSSDNNFMINDTGSKNSSPYQDASNGLQGLFQSPPMPFTFKMPSNLQSDGRFEPVPTTQAARSQSGSILSQMLPQSLSFFQHSPLTSAALGQQQQQHVYQSQVPEPANNAPASTSKLSTTLIYVDGLPRYVELVHDNSEIQPNPIILPITRVAQRKK
ncbi:hypothetical protein IWW48_004369 [Coemansia sp. RSA 1200]|nr:hypothetical protein IWW48_004369 [Coemansia sp. RSA 1200]